MKFGQKGFENKGILICINLDRNALFFFSFFDDLGSNQKEMGRILRYFSHIFNRKSLIQISFTLLWVCIGDYWGINFKVHNIHTQTHAHTDTHNTKCWCLNCKRNLFVFEAVMILYSSHTIIYRCVTNPMIIHCVATFKWELECLFSVSTISFENIIILFDVHSFSLSLPSVLRSEKQHAYLNCVCII